MRPWVVARFGLSPHKLNRVVQHTRENDYLRLSISLCAFDLEDFVSRMPVECTVRNSFIGKQPYDRSSVQQRAALL